MKKPRLTDADRCLIEAELRARKTPYATAKGLNRPIKTILREIRGRAVESDKGAAYRLKNRCVHGMDCTRRLVCGGCVRPDYLAFTAGNPGPFGKGKWSIPRGKCHHASRRHAFSGIYFGK